jgi:YidC/Oxa1 family membrane protein insertase
MDFQRLFLFLIFVFSLGLVWDGWQRYQHPELYVPQSTAGGAPSNPEAQPSAAIPAAVSVSPAVQPPVAQQVGQKAAGKVINVKTDILEAEISTIGGDISYLALLKHPDALDRNKPLVLFHRGAGTHNYVAQSGLLGTGLPSHNSQFVSELDRYVLADNADAVQVRLRAEGQGAIKVTKVITFHKGSYLIDIAYELENTGQQPFAASSYYQLTRDSAALAGSSVFLPTYVGAAVYTENEKFQKVEFQEIEKGKTEYPKQADNGWIGILQQYFVAAWIPKEKGVREYFTRKLDGDLYSAGVILPEQVINPSQKMQMSATLYAGPAQSSLDKIAPGLGLTVDYGWLTILSAPLFWVMELFHDWTHNWGVAIILLTVLIKLFFFPLSAASYRSMAKMRVVAPKLEKIRQQCGADREKLNRAMMDLYKTEKINPLGGCLPVLVQIPVFIALYWAILASVELRYAPFFGWITDLSAADPYYILPIIMGASMIIQMRLNPKPTDPMQARIMQIMPIAFSAIFFIFPAGLVLYSIVNNILSIAQQWYITRAAEDASKAAAAKR